MPYSVYASAVYPDNGLSGSRLTELVVVATSDNRLTDAPVLNVVG
jgi:hypothetical protein